MKINTHLSIVLWNYAKSKCFSMNNQTKSKATVNFISQRASHIISPHIEMEGGVRRGERKKNII